MRSAIFDSDYVNDGDMIAMLRLGVLDTLGELRS
jgi:hypothetical protein